LLVVLGATGAGLIVYVVLSHLVGSREIGEFMRAYKRTRSK